jgi:hypothetical protein
MEETVIIQSIETKTTKAGIPMWTASTNVGKMSIFDKLISDKLFALINKNVIVETVIKNNFKNIVRFVGIAEGFVNPPVPIETIKVERDKNRVASASMMISYAKDLCIAGKIELKDIDVKSKEFLAIYESML